MPIAPATQDCEVLSREFMEPVAGLFDKPFLVVLFDGTILQYDTEKEACAFQRGWRMAIGLSPDTGEPV